MHIGIVGVSAEGAALCYRTICVEGAQYFGPDAHPEVSMHTSSFAEYRRLSEREDWPATADLMLASAQKLAAIGADFLICPANTPHLAFPWLEPRSPLPWLNIAGVVADEATRRGFHRIGILGTRYLADSNLYPEHLAARGLEALRPTPDERATINRFIYDELVRGICTPAATEYHQQVIARLKSEGCDAVVLGCTEIPLIINDTNSPLPTLDSTRLLAHAALRKAAGEPVIAAFLNAER
jgi:aspartate racemase